MIKEKLFQLWVETATGNDDELVGALKNLRCDHCRHWVMEFDAHTDLGRPEETYCDNPKSPAFERSTDTDFFCAMWEPK
jgi:arginase family enzyme